MTTRNMTHLRRAKSFSDFELDRLRDVLEVATKELEDLQDLQEEVPNTDTSDPYMKSKKRIKDNLDIALSELFSIITEDVKLVIND